MVKEKTLLPGGHFVVLGETGGGKTDFMAQIVQMLKQKMSPQEKSKKDEQDAQ